MTKAMKTGLLVGAGLAALALGAYLEGLVTWPESKVPWFTTRSAGVTAYLLLSASTIWGLLTSSRLLMQWVKPPASMELHRFLSFLALAVTALHGAALLFDSQFNFQAWEVLVPLLSPYRPVAVAAGVIGGYLAALLTWSFYLRQRLGQAAWRAFHYTGFLAFVLATAHGIFSGSDSPSLWMQAIYLASGAAVLFLTYVRVLGGRFIPTRTPAPASGHHTREAASPNGRVREPALRG